MDQKEVRANQVAFQITDEKHFQLLKKIAKKVANSNIKKPKKNCKYCYGRDYVGYLNGVKSLPVPCRCIYQKNQSR